MSSALRDALNEALDADRMLHFYDFSGFQSEYSYPQLKEMARHRFRFLEEAGVGPGVVIALMGPTNIELVQNVLAVWLAGATITILPTPTRLGNLEQFLTESLEKLKRSRATLLIGEEDSVSIFRELAGIPVWSWDETAPTPLKSTEEVVDEGTALIQFSSGTTREPQPIVLTQEALLKNSRAVLDCFPGGAENHSCVSWLPLYHDMGLIGCFLMPLLAPGDLTLMGPEVFAVRPHMWLRAISEQRATTSSAPNFALARCAERATQKELESLDLSCWKIAMVGAETVRPHTLKKFAGTYGETGFDEAAFSPVYGLAEATLAVTFSPLAQGHKILRYDPELMATEGILQAGEREMVSLGRPLESVDVQIRKEGKLLGEGRLGEVWIKSASLLSGILGPDGPNSILKDGWLETGDAGFLHQGELYLYGRRRDILLLDGRNHDPSVIEGAAESLSVLRRCCAYVEERPEEEKDSLVLLCEVSVGWRGEGPVLVDQIRTQCRRQANLVPHRVVLLRAGELPVTSSGKLRRGVALRMEKSNKFRTVDQIGV